MKMISDYQAKKVLVLGLGKSGFSVAKLLVKLGAKVTLNDKQTVNDQNILTQLKQLGIKVVTGSHPLELLNEAQIVVKNPGIPYSNELIQAAQAKGLPIITEPEVATKVLEASLIGVTGSNGKTTTTTLISLMLNAGFPNKKAYAAGNIGIPLADVASKATVDDTVVAELSSFQLLGMQTVHPKVAVLTNIYEAHIDYHGSRQAYVEAKLRLIQNQTSSDYFVVNWDEIEWQELSKKAVSKVVPFSRKNLTQAGAYQKAGALYFKGEKIIDVTDIKLPGTHNIENALAAICVAKIFGVKTAAICEVLATFGGVRHRTQYVTTINGRKFYNDSKATNMPATQKALSGFADNVILLAGGLDRGFTFENLVPDFKEHVCVLVVFGQTAKLLAKAGKQAGIKEIVEVKDAVAAVKVGYELSKPGDVILLSPACASWDQWPTFEVRGDKYIEEIQRLAQEVGGN